MYIESLKKPMGLDPLFKAAGMKHDIPAALLKAIARRESNFRPSAVSRPNTNGTRDYGLMQINQINFKNLGLNPTTALDPEKSVYAAATLLAQNRKALGNKFNIYNWISSYNAGVGRVLRSGIINKDYVADVYLHYNVYGEVLKNV